ncbi:DUF1800 domain-containing protein [Caldimonas brevitalea]|uniref:DUF1800 domain-containing protein n=1 Tax=Caldimonas brevitalea TaxID=413882 RepID=A0A0G3BZ53_9BURK|nr:DUF1800 domain-containing protein [Caldimonas brevitalea]AKJ31765.1 hypothetical protein AAW51_5074 [Caldimonas brevitalea]
MKPLTSAWAALRRPRRLHALSLCLLLAACGGSDGDRDDTPEREQPVAEMPPTRQEAARFLTQASFGPTEREVETLMQIGYHGWLDEQFRRGNGWAHRQYWDSVDATLKSQDPNRSAGQREVLDTFWKRAVEGDDQLRQRVAYALSQIFVISMVDGNVAERPRGVAGYMDTLAEHAFGNYRDLLEAVARHPMMGIYLSHLRNQKEDPTTGRVPDQNFAREVMQLFSIGLNRLNPDGTPVLGAQGRPQESYNSDDIVGLSRVFTGFSWYSTRSDDACFHGWSQCQDPDRLWRTMRAYPKFHSVLDKRFLGRTAPASADPEASLDAALDTLYQHPNVGPFIGKQLIQRLVTSNPSPRYVARVTAAFNNNGAGVRGDMRAVVKAVLLDPEARAANAAADPGYGKLREPVLRLSAFLRAFGARSASGSYLIGSTDNPGSQLGQTPMRSPSVFNFYRPGYVPPNTRLAEAGQVAPEMQITHETTVAGYANFMLDVVRNGVGQHGLDYRAPKRDVQLDFSRELLLVERPAELVERLNQLLVCGQMGGTLRDEIRQAVESIPIPVLNATRTNQEAIDKAKAKRVQAAVFLALVSPEFIAQK